jgi:hypothetical protein
MMIVRWVGLGALAVTGAIFFAAPVALAGILLGTFWGTVALTAGSIVVTTAALSWAPTIGHTTAAGRGLHRLHDWAIRRAEHPGAVVRWAYHAGSGVGFVVSSILLGPTLTSLMVALVRGHRRRLWPIVVGSSLVFSVFAMNLFVALRALVTR